MYTKDFDSQDIAAFHDWSAEARSIVLLSHMNADGDACGSILGLAMLLERAAGKGCQVVPILPNGCPSNFTWLPYADRIVSGESQRGFCSAAIREADLVVCVDFNTASRIDMLQDDLLQAKGKKVLIDHHHNPSTQQFDIIFSDPHISSTCELVLWLSQAVWGCQNMDSDVARCLYTGLSTDTGGFAFSCDQPSCFDAAATLVAYNIEPAEIHNRIINTFSLNRMSFYGFALSQRMRVYPTKHVALMAFSLDDQRRFGVGGEDMEGLVNYTLMMKEIEVGALLREEHGRTKVSLRAKYGVDVNRIAMQLGGGGHTKASGATCTMPFDETLAAVEKLLGIDNEKPIYLMPA